MDIDRFIVLLTYLLIRLLALFLWFWLGSVTGHTPFQYPGAIFIFHLL